MRHHSTLKELDPARHHAADEWAQDVLAKMTLAEKIGQLNQVSEDSAGSTGGSGC